MQSAQRAFLRHFLSSLLVALALEYLVVPPLLSTTRIGRAIEDTTLDWVIGMYVGTSPRPGRALVTFTIMDIDDDTYQHWGEPLVVPRDRLLSLIRFAVEGKARLVIVDVDLSKSVNKAEDTGLIRYLARWTEPDPPAVPLIFTRVFHTSRDGRTPSEPRSSIVDDVVAKSNRIYYAATLFDADADLVIRRWRLWQPTCGHSLGDSVPSVQLLTLAILQDPAGQGVRHSLSAIDAFACRYQVSSDSSRSVPRLHLGDRALHIDPDHLQRRIIYSLPWRLASGRARPMVQLDGRPAPLLIVLSAQDVVEAGRVSAGAVAGRVVIVGGSFSEGRDIYATPVGAMHGAFLLVNSVHSLLHAQELTHAPEWMRVALLAILTMLITALSQWSWGRGWLPSAIVILVIVAVGSLYLFRFSIWLEFAVSPIAVIVDHVLHKIGHGVRGVAGLLYEARRGR